MKNFHDKDYVDLKNSKDRDRMYARFDEAQKALFASVQNTLFTYCEATTGSGKTTVATAALLDLLANGEIDSIVYVRVADDRAQSLGFLPGDVDEKSACYFEPFYEALETLGLQPEAIRILETQGLIKTTLDTTLRGRNLKKSGIILDECQNADLATLKLIFTRMHDDVHAVAIGDGLQQDQKRSSDQYKLYCEFLAASPLGNKCELTHNYRGRFSRLAESYHL